MTLAGWLAKLVSKVPLVTLQSLTVRSSPPEARMVPSGLKATALTRDEWPVRLVTRLSPATFHNLTVASSLAEATNDPSGLKATPWMRPRCCVNTLPVDPSGEGVSARKLDIPDANIVPLGLMA